MTRPSDGELAYRLELDVDSSVAVADQGSKDSKDNKNIMNIKSGKSNKSNKGIRGANGAAVEVEAALRELFQLQHSLRALYAQWSQPPSTLLATAPRRAQLNADFAMAAAKLRGLRLLRQAPSECLFSFLCSQNNNIPRISLMLRRLCERYGTALGEVAGERYFAFPSLPQLSGADEGTLRELGFGYRAKYLPRAVQQVEERGGEAWLLSLRSRGVEEVRTALTELMGIGDKVADCVALFSLDQLSLVPVDTHVLQIAQRYMPHLHAANAKTRHEVSALFGSAFGAFAGWAHTILFAREIAAFQALFDSTAPTPAPATAKKRKRAAAEEQDQQEQKEAEGDVDVAAAVSVRPSKKRRRNRD